MPKPSERSLGNTWRLASRRSYFSRRLIHRPFSSSWVMLGLGCHLVAAATVYLSTLAKRAANATWDRLASGFNSKEVKPLTAVAKTLATAADSVDGEVTIAVGLNIPDDYFGTAISIKRRDPEEVARVLASFIVHVEQISKAMEAEVKAGRTPLGRASIELQDDGSLLVSWVAQDDFSRHELRISRWKVEDSDPFKEEAPLLATVVAAARAGDTGAIKFLKTRACDQAWRLDPENDWRQPEVAEILKNGCRTEANDRPMSNQETDRAKLTFSQAEGLDPLPQPGALGSLPKRARVHLWNLIYIELICAVEKTSLGYGRNNIGNEPDDAVFMFGACTAFAAYLVNKARNAGLLSDH